MNDSTNMSTSNNYFASLSAINVNDHIEKKGQFNYLSWPYAVAQLRIFDETATWEVIRFNGLPFLTTDNGTFVEVAVTVRSITLSQIHPVLDHKNRPIDTPTVFDINTSIQRCLVKAIALHGLGLNVYAGEDLPANENAFAANGQTMGFKTIVLNRQYDERSNSPELLTANQLRYIKRLMLETGTDVEQLVAFFDFESLETIPKHEVNRVIQKLEEYRPNQAA